MSSPNITSLYETIKKLRDPEKGCPWDLEQTHKTLRKYLIEECFELIHAIEQEDSSELLDELGDVQLQILLHSIIKEEENTFSLQDVFDNLEKKIIRRHPHVFSENSAITVKQVKENWQKIKTVENKKQAWDQKVFGTKKQTKQDLVTEICAVLAFSAIQNNDKVGVIFFSDQIEKFIPPKKGKSHILMIIRELIDFQPEHRGTDINEALRYFSLAIKKRCTAFLMSDFLADDFFDTMKITNKKHDLVAVQLYDEREMELPNVGLVQMKDAESDQLKWFDTSSAKNRMVYKTEAIKKQAQIADQIRKSGVDHVKIATHQSYIQPLMNLFKRRESRR